MVGERGWRKAGLVSFFLLPALLPLLIFRVLPMLASVGVSAAGSGLSLRRFLRV